MSNHRQQIFFSHNSSTISDNETWQSLYSPAQPPLRSGNRVDYSHDLLTASEPLVRSSHSKSTAARSDARSHRDGLALFAGAKEDGHVNDLSRSFHSLPFLSQLELSPSAAVNDAEKVDGQRLSLSSAGSARFTSRQVTELLIAGTPDKNEREGNTGNLPKVHSASPHDSVFATVLSQASSGTFSRESVASKEGLKVTPFSGCRRHRVKAASRVLPIDLEDAVHTPTEAAFGFAKYAFPSRRVVKASSAAKRSFRERAEITSVPSVRRSGSTGEAPVSCTNSSASASLLSLDSANGVFSVSSPIYLTYTADSLTAELTPFSAGFHGGSGSTAKTWAPQYALPCFARNSSQPSLDDSSGRGLRAGQYPPPRGVKNRYGGYRELDEGPVAKPLHLQLAQQRREAGLNAYGDLIETQDVPLQRASLLRRVCEYYKRKDHNGLCTPSEGEQVAQGCSAIWREILHGLSWLALFGLAIPFAVVSIFVLITHYSALQLCGEKCYCNALDSFLYVVTSGWFYYIPVAAFTPALFVLFLKVGDMHDGVFLSSSKSSTSMSATASAPDRAASRSRDTSRGLAMREGDRQTLSVSNSSSNRHSAASFSHASTGSQAAVINDEVVDLSMVTVDVVGASSPRRAPPLLHGRLSIPSSSASLHTATGGNTVANTAPSDSPSCQAKASYNRQVDSDSGAFVAAYRWTPPDPAVLRAEEEREPRHSPPDFLFAEATIDPCLYSQLVSADAREGKQQMGCGIVSRAIGFFLPPPFIVVGTTGLSSCYDASTPSVAATVAHSRSFWTLTVLRYLCLVFLDTQLPAAPKVPFRLYGLLRTCAITLPVFLYSTWLLLPMLALPFFLVDYFSGILLVLFSTTATDASAHLGLLASWPVLVFVLEKLAAYLAVGAIKRCPLDVFTPAGSSLSVMLKTLLATVFAALYYTMIFAGSALHRVENQDGVRAVLPFTLVFFATEMLSRTVLVERVILRLLGFLQYYILRHSRTHPGAESEDKEENIQAPSSQQQQQQQRRRGDKDSREDSVEVSVTTRRSHRHTAHAERSRTLDDSALTSKCRSSLPVVITGTSFASLSTRVRGGAALVAVAVFAPVFLFGQWPRDPARANVDHTTVFETVYGANGLPYCRGYVIVAAATEEKQNVRWPELVLALAVSLVSELLYITVAYVKDARWQKLLLQGRRSSRRERNAQARRPLDPTPEGVASSVSVLPSSTPLVLKDAFLLVSIGWFTAAVGISTALMVVPVWLPSSS